MPHSRLAIGDEKGVDSIGRLAQELQVGRHEAIILNSFVGQITLDKIKLNKEKDQQIPTTEHHHHPPMTTYHPPTTTITTSGALGRPTNFQVAMSQVARNYRSTYLSPEIFLTY